MEDEREMIEKEEIICSFLDDQFFSSQFSHISSTKNKKKTTR